MRLRSSDLFTTEVEGQLVLLDARTSRYLTTNEVGTFIVRLLETGVSEADIVAAVQHEFRLDDEVALTDCRSFIEQLTAQGLIES